MKRPLQNVAKTPVARLAACCGVLLASLLTSCQSTNTPSARAIVELAPAHYFDAKTGIYFPGALGKLFRKPIVQLENKTPGLGLAITYRSTDARIDVFIFDLQASIIPSGIDSRVIRQSFESGIDDLRKASQSRLYRNLQLSPTSARQLGDSSFLQASFTYDESLLPKEGKLLVGGVNGQILKIRAAKTRGSPTDLERLLGYVGQAIAQSHDDGYGGIDGPSYRAIARSLEAINLDDGLSEGEAVAIAQIELVSQQRHNRYDATTARVTDHNLPELAIVEIQPYPSQPTTQTAPIRFFVQRNGEASLLAATD